MRLSLTQEQLGLYVAKQLSNIFPDKEVQSSALQGYIVKTLERTELCFSHINDKYFFDGSQTIFSHLHTDQYAMFLYYLGNTIWRNEGDLSLASKVYYLNKALHAVDIFYEVQLPDIFVLVHPLSTVLGRGRYANYFVAYQRCTVGANSMHEFPVIDEGVVMYGGSMLVGRCHIHRNCRIAAGAIVMDLDVPANQVIFGCHPTVQTKPSKQDVFERNFRMLT